jgi:hypothetical protein
MFHPEKFAVRRATKDVSVARKLVMVESRS